MAGLIASLVGTAAAWGVTTFVMRSDFVFPPAALALTILACTAMTGVFGWVGTGAALRARPAPRPCPQRVAASAPRRDVAQSRPTTGRIAAMLESQREKFELPRAVCYLNAAAWSPLPIAGQQAGIAGVARKGKPWLLDRDLQHTQHERTRAAAAALINAAPRDVALISSVGYGVAIAGKILDIPSGSRVLVLEEDHTSPVLEWLTRAPAQGFSVDTVRRPADGDWTAAVLNAIARPGAPVALASISSVRWSDGGLVDLARVGAALKAKGAMLLVDATHHHAGVIAIDVKALDPDVLIFPTYKWTLGPYGRAFAYVAPRHAGGVPLEQTGFGRVGISRNPPPTCAT